MLEIDLGFNKIIWKPVNVVEKVHVDNRSYIVKAPNDGIYRRNRRHLMKIVESHSTPDVTCNDPAFSVFVLSQLITYFDGCI
jgi:hypothetical protein